MRFAVLIAFLFASACQVTTVAPRAPQQAARPAPPPVSTSVQRRFESVVQRVGPVAVAACRARTRGRDCRFQIFVDMRPGLPPNAFQTVDRSRRPVIVFTRALVERARNDDEIALILGHEAAHHILGHIPQIQRSAQQGALIGAVLAGALGADGATARDISRQGAFIGSRRFSKEFELQADVLGTQIAARAGYNPVRGADYLARARDPGDRFLGTHPPNPERIAVIRRTAAGL